MKCVFGTLSLSSVVVISNFNYRCRGACPFCVKQNLPAKAIGLAMLKYQFIVLCKVIGYDI